MIPYVITMCCFKKKGDFYDSLRTEYYTWDGTDLGCTVLASEPGCIEYGKLIDMDQDGTEELIFIMENCSRAVAYSWKGTSWVRTLLHEEAFTYDGFYRDAVTGNIYLGITEWRLAGIGEGIAFNGLTDHFDYSFSTEEIIDRPYEELTPAERDKADIKIAGAQKEYERKLDRFEYIEGISPSRNSPEFFDQLQFTVDEARQQLMTR